MKYLRVLVLLVVPLTVRGQSADTARSTTPTQTARVCGADQSRPPGMVFADPHGDGEWRKFSALADVPELEDDAGDAALVWPGQKGNLLVRVIEPGEEYWIRTDYCFDGDGRLVQVRFDFRTLGEWGYREEGPIRGGELASETSQFFDQKTQARIALPDTATYGESLKPQLYLRRSELPFAALLPSGQ
jgi:hypothetical protein